MNNEEYEMFFNLIAVLEKEKRINKKFYNSPDTKFIKKNEFVLSNDVKKGLILFEYKRYFLLDIYISDSNNILNGLLNLKIESKEDAEIEYNNYIEYVEKTSVLQIMKNKIEKNNQPLIK